MNSSKKARCHGAFLRVRKRNSTSNKPASHDGVHNATQHHTSLLKNNKSLAVTLQETRCELSTYRNLFEESQEYMSKAKLAKSKMMQLSTAFKDLIKAFDESLLLLEVDDSKWPNIKASTQSSKKVPKGLNPVLEVAHEMEEVVPTDEEMNCDEENNPECSDQVFETTSNPPTVFQKDFKSSIDEEKFNDNAKMSRKSPKKKIEKLESNSHFQTKNVTGDMKTKAKVLKFSPRKSANSNYIKKMLSSSLSSQAAKVTKIPRYQALSIDLQKESVLRKFRPQNKSYKLKSPEKKCDESDFSRRKTFVIKSSKVLENFDSAEDITEKNNCESIVEETSNVSEGSMISKIDKRKTFVKKNSNILKETAETTSEDEPLLNNDRRKTCIVKSSDSLKTFELSANLNKIAVETKVVTENRVILSEPTDAEDNTIISKDRRKTFVKKSSNKIMLHQDNDVPEHQTSLPNNGCASANSELLSAVTEDDDVFKAFSELQLNMNRSETDHAVAKNKSVFAETFKPAVEDTLFNVASQAPSDEIEKNKTITADESNTEEKMEETSQNLKSKIDNDITNLSLTEIISDVLNRGVICSDASLKDENVINTLSNNSSLESIGSENEIEFIDKINFCRSSFKSTPIRGQISQNKRKKFVFDVKKRKSILKRNSFCENNNNAANSNESNVDGAKVKNVQFVSDELANADNPASLQSDSCTVRKKATKTYKKIKDNQERPRKSSTEKKANKPRTIKNKKNKAKDIQMDDLISKPKKIKKRNTKKKKNEDIYFDDNTISKCRENDEFTTSKITETDGTEKELESDFPCEKTGKNTFLVHAEIHPPPSSLNMHNMKLNKENKKLNLQHMQVSVVLDDVLKSKDIDLLNICDRDLLSTRTVSLKTPFSSSSSFASIDPNESIEKLRSDPAPETHDLDLNCDTFLNTDNCDLQNNPVLDTENPRPRRHKEVNYKEPSLHRKMRRC